MVTPAIQKILIVVITVLLAGFLGYNLLTATPDVSVYTDSMNNTDQAGQEILVLVTKMQSISIDGSIFSSPLFSHLVDFDVTPIPEPAARSNPFAPIGYDGALSIKISTSTTKAKTQTQTSEF